MATETVAKNLLCPKTLPSGMGYGCHGSRCMAWRWDRDLNTQIMADAQADWQEDCAGEGVFMGSTHWTGAMAARDGYCGLAGADQ